MAQVGIPEAAATCEMSSGSIPVSRLVRFADFQPVSLELLGAVDFRAAAR